MMHFISIAAKVKEFLGEFRDPSEDNRLPLTALCVGVGFNSGIHIRESSRA